MKLSNLIAATVFVMSASAFAQGSDQAPAAEGAKETKTVTKSESKAPNGKKMKHKKTTETKEEKKAD